MRNLQLVYSTVRGIYPYLPMATNAPWSILGGSLILNFNIQKCEFCAQI